MTLVNIDAVLENADWPKVRKSDLIEDLRAAGGQGSGNFGHAGRPGEVGGSASGGSGSVFAPNADEQEHIMSWAWPNSGGTYHYDALRDPKTESGKEMTAILNKLPEYDGVTYRGVALDNPKDIEALVSAKGYKLNLHSSASTELETALNFAEVESIGGEVATAVIMELHGRGRDIHALLPEELQDTKEVVAMAGTRYRFKSLSHAEAVRPGFNTKYPYMKIVLEEVR